MTDLQKKAEEIYRKMTSYANYSEMNGISKKWFLQKIEQGLQEYHQSELLKLNKSDVISSVCICGYPNESAGYNTNWKMVCSSCGKPKQTDL